MFKKIIIVFFILCLSCNVYAFKNQKLFVENITNLKIFVSKDSSLNEYNLLKNILTDLIISNNNIKSCTILKICVDHNFLPYEVLKILYSLPYDNTQLCNCSVTNKINKSIILKSLKDSELSNIQQLQYQVNCFKTGLSYTEISNIPEKPIPFSNSKP